MSGFIVDKHHRICVIPVGLARQRLPVATELEGGKHKQPWTERGRSIARPHACGRLLGSRTRPVNWIETRKPLGCLRVKTYKVR